MVDKVYVVRKYVIAKSAEEAIKKSKKLPVDDVWVEDETHKSILNKLIEKQGAIGFKK